MSQNTASLIRLATVIQKTGFEANYIYKEIAAGRFPRQVKCGAKASRWVSTEVDQWIESQIASRDQGAKP